MTETIKQAIEKILSKGDRAEVIPGPNGTVKVIRVSRKEDKNEEFGDPSKRANGIASRL